jgi:hypothetical protein
MRSSKVLLVTIVTTGVLYVAGCVALGSGYPTAESTGAEVVGWFTDNASRARIYAWTAAFVSLELGIFGGQLSTLFPSRTGTSSSPACSGSRSRPRCRPCSGRGWRSTDVRLHRA